MTLWVTRSSSLHCVYRSSFSWCLTIVGMLNLAIACWILDNHRNYQCLIHKIDEMISNHITE